MVSRWPKSEKEYQRAKQVIPGGVNSPARAFGGVGGNPLVIREGRGSYLYDLDGNRYIDYIGSWGPLILGHQHPKVSAALHEAIDHGTSFGAPTPGESDLAELVVAAVPSIEQVRMVSSGTEATMSAIRVARGFTGRDKIVKLAGCYHGHVDSLLVQAGSAATTLGAPSSPGIPRGATQDTIVLAYNDVDALRQTFQQHPDSIACVILEPVVGNMGLVTPLPGYLEAAREITAKAGALLIFDEVMTGFRLAYGGAQERFNITPDMSALGKIIGGGLPVGAYGGRDDIMAVVSPRGPVYQAGTLSGNPLAMASGLATLRELQDHPPYAHLEELSQKLEEGIVEAIGKAGIDAHVARVGSMMTLFFHPGPVRNYAEALASNTAQFAALFWKLIERGVYFPCSQFEAMFLSAAHSEGDIEHTIAAIREALHEMATNPVRST